MAYMKSGHAVTQDGCCGLATVVYAFFFCECSSLRGNVCNFSVIAVNIVDLHLSPN